MAAARDVPLQQDGSVFNTAWWRRRSPLPVFYGVTLGQLALTLAAICVIIVVLAYAMSSVLAGVAGLLVVPVLHAYSLMGVLPGLKAFAVAIIGGLGNPFGILLAGLLLGVVEFIVAIFDASLRDAVTFFLLIVILAWRPLGLFETAQAQKV